MARYGSLIEEVSSIIYEEIPLNLTCPHCEQEMEITNIMEIKGYEKEWDKLSTKVIRLVAEGLAPYLEKITEKDIEEL